MTDSATIENEWLQRVSPKTKNENGIFLDGYGYFWVFLGIFGYFWVLGIILGYVFFIAHCFLLIAVLLIAV
jgi:hypothetical protein